MLISGKHAGLVNFGINALRIKYFIIQPINRLNLKIVKNRTIDIFNVVIKVIELNVDIVRF